VPHNLVHIIDDDTDIRHSLFLALTSAGFAVRTFSSATEFLESLHHLGSGCIVSDIRMPGVDGLSLLRQLKIARVAVPVIIMTGHADIPLAVQVMKEGAYEFVEKPFDPDALMSTIRLAFDHQSKVGNREVEVDLVRNKVELLTTREREVLVSLVGGRANKAIAYHLQISARTVEVHRVNVMNKMGARSLPELVRMAITGGY
jgi:two-component system, LuxR family, response regulator FixJ